MGSRQIMFPLKKPRSGSQLHLLGAIFAPSKNKKGEPKIVKKFPF